jgi:invasion protein IalB
MPRVHFKRLVFVALIAIASGLAASLSPAAAQNPHGKAFGDWRIRCNSATGAPSKCQMVQNVIVKDSGRPILQSVIGFIDDAPNPIGVFVLPLGIYLPAGLTLQIDKGQIYEMSLEICGQKGCRVRFSIDDALLRTFKNGNVAEVGFQTGLQKPITVPLSLKGFTAAIGQLR